MKDQFYIVLPSNSSMQYFADNTTTHFTTQLPQQLRLQGTWVVAITEIQIPLTFQHISTNEEERFVSVNRFPGYSRETNAIEKISNTEVSLVSPGIYTDVSTIVHEINSLNSTKNHFELAVNRGGYVSIGKICETCPHSSHELSLSKKLQKILGFANRGAIIIKNQDSIESSIPAHLSTSLPSVLMIYSDICEPYMTGDVQTQLLRVVPLDVDSYTYGGMRIKSFSSPMYIPLLFNCFQTIEIDIRDQHGCPIPFDYGTLTVTLHFKRIE